MKGLIPASCALLTYVLTPCVWAATLGPLPPAADQALARSILKELVEINTTHPYGSTEAAQAIQGHLLEAGFSASDVVLVAPPEHPIKGNVEYTYRLTKAMSQKN